MTEQDKVTVDDIIGIVKTEEQTNSVEEVRKLRGRGNETVKRITREKITNIVNRAYSQYYRLYSNEMSLTEKLFFQDMQKTITNIVYERLGELEKELEE